MKVMGDKCGDCTCAYYTIVSSGISGNIHGWWCGVFDKEVDGFEREDMERSINCMARWPHGFKIVALEEAKDECS